MENKTKTFQFGKNAVGGKDFFITAGPCSIESKEQFESTAKWVQKQGVSFLRGGIYKMRTNPESFQGHGLNALTWVQDVKNKTGLPFIAEVTDPRQLPDFHDFVDVYQVGSRNMYNYSLLKDLGKTNKTILLKRGFSATIEEWLQAAQYITAGGNDKVILCERGIRGFDNKTRNVLDLAAVAYIKQNSNFPIFVDPSHATGVRSLVIPMALAAVVAGADGIMVEVHPDPKAALSDGPQALTFDDYENLIPQIEKLLALQDRKLVRI